MNEHAYCTRRHCGTRLVEGRSAVGRVILFCEPCAVNKAGHCRTPGCAGRLPHFRSMYCLACKRVRLLASNNAAQLRRYHGNPKVRARQVKLTKLRLSDPAKHAAYIEYCRDYRAKNPPNDIDRMLRKLSKKPRTPKEKRRDNRRRRLRYKTDAVYRAKKQQQNRDNYQARQRKNAHSHRQAA